MAQLTSSKRKRIEKLVLDVMSALDKTGKNPEAYKKRFEEMSDKQFEAWAKRMASDEDFHFYLECRPYDNEPNLDQIETAAKVTGTQLHQYVYFRHDGSKDKPIRTAVKVPVGYLHVKRLQQLLFKKTSYSTDATRRSQLTGQLYGEDAVGRVSDEEAYALKTIGADYVLKELLGPRADNKGKRLEMYKAIDRNGFARYDDLKGDLKDQATLNYLDSLLLAAGLKSDLIDTTLLLRATVESPADKQKK